MVYAEASPCDKKPAVRMFCQVKKTEIVKSPMRCRSFYYAGAFDGGLELFFSQLVNGQQAEGGLLDRFLIQCMLFHHAVLTCPSYKGTTGSFQLSSAARSQVSLTTHSTHQALTHCNSRHWQKPRLHWGLQARSGGGGERGGRGRQYHLP